MISGTLKPSVVWGSSSAVFESSIVKDRPVASHPAPHVCWSTSTATGSCRVAADGVSTEAAAEAALFSEEPTSPDDPSEGLKVKKDAVGEFDVYFVLDDFIKSDDITASKRPLVLLFTWLNARPNHVMKYISLYLEKGMDVLVVPFNLEHVVTPRLIKESVNKLLSVLTERNGPLAERPLIVHGFSIGAFVWGQLMIQMKKPDAEDECSTSTFDFTDSSSPFGTHVSAFAADAAGDAAGGKESGLKKGDKTAEQTDSKEVPCHFNDVQQRITGVVLDSPTMTETMMEGVRQSITSSVLGTAFKNVLPLYLRVFSRSVGSFYTTSEQAYLRNPSGLPTLIFYSDADPVSPARLLDKVVSDWQTGGVDVHVQKWEDSSHVKHFSSYPEEYKEALEVFVDRCMAQIKDRSAS